MNSKQLKYFKDKLIQEKNELLKQIENNNNFGLDISMNDSIGELSGYDNHPADIATELYDREKDIGIRDNQMRILDLTNEALQRLEEGNFGYCVNCNKELPLERLEAIPYAKYCIEHQPNYSNPMERPVEEQFLTPPFGRTSFDNKDNETEFDGEDSWQSVARFGTSDSTDYFSEDDYEHLYDEAKEPIGYVENLEGFIITDLDGNSSEDEIDITRNEAYDAYMENFEGEEGISETPPTGLEEK